MAGAYGAEAIAASAAGTSVPNQASATSVDSTLTSRAATWNTVVTVVRHAITNHDNGADTFALAASNSSAFTMANMVFYPDANAVGQVALHHVGQHA